MATIPAETPTPRWNAGVVEGIAAIVVGVFGTAIFVVVPFFTAFVKDERPFDEAQVSLISSADMAGMFLASLFAAYWVRTVNWRVAALVSLAVLIAGTAGSIATASFAVFGLTRIVSGIGAGSLMAIGLAAMADRPRPDAWFGWFVTFQALLGAAAGYLTPRLIGPYGLDGLLIVLIALYVIAVPFALVIAPRAAPILPPVETDAARLPTSLPLAWLSLAATFLFAMAAYAVWSHLELIARASGIAAVRVGDAISAAYLIGIGASFASAVLAGRFHRGWFFLLIGVGQLVALALLWSGGWEIGFAIAVVLWQSLWCFSTAFQMGATVSLDPTGRFVVLFISAIKAAYVASGFFLSLLLAGGAPIGRVAMFAAVCATVSLLAYLLLARRAPGIVPADHRR